MSDIAISVISQVLQTNKDDYIIDSKAHGELILDIITQEPIKYKHYMIIDNQIYNFYTLYNYIRYKYNKDREIATIPHNRKSFTVKLLEEINSKFKNKSKIIFEIIKFRFLEFPQEMQECLLALKDNEREILLETYKIDLMIMLSNLDCDLIIRLITYHYYLLVDNVSDDDIKQALKKDYRALLFLSNDKITEDIAKFVVQIDGMSLMILHPRLRTEELINLAIVNNNIIRKYIHKGKTIEEIIKIKGISTEEIIKLAVEECIDKLKNVLSEKLKVEIVTESITKEINTLKYLLNEKITSELITQNIINNNIELENISSRIIIEVMTYLAIMNDSNFSLSES